MAGKFDKYLT